MKKSKRFEAIIIAFMLLLSFGIFPNINAYAETSSGESNSYYGSYNEHEVTIELQKDIGEAGTVSVTQTDDTTFEISAIANENYSFSEWVCGQNENITFGQYQCSSTFTATLNENPTSVNEKIRYLLQMTAYFASNNPGQGVPPSAPPIIEENHNQGGNVTPSAAPEIYEAPAVYEAPKQDGENTPSSTPEPAVVETQINVDTLLEAIPNISSEDKAVISNDTYNFSSFTTTEGFASGIEKILTKADAGKSSSAATSVSFYTQSPFTFSPRIAAAICNDKYDVIYTFKYKGRLYSITIPKGTKPEALLGSNNFDGPITIGGRLGTLRMY